MIPLKVNLNSVEKFVFSSAYNFHIFVLLSGCLLLMHNDLVGRCSIAQQFPSEMGG